MWRRGAVIYCAECHRECEVMIMTHMIWRQPHITHCPLCGSAIKGQLVPKEEFVPEEYERAKKK